MTKAPLPDQQRGAALLTALLIIVLALAAFLSGALSTTSSKLQQQRTSEAILAAAKDAVLASAVSLSDVGWRPGNLHFPDALTSTESPANYDGQADNCYRPSTFNPDVSGNPVGLSSNPKPACLGRLPWKTLGTQLGADISQEDSLGLIPWYAVSANLLNPACLLKLNPGIAGLTHDPGAPFLCDSKSSLPYSWLTVRDRSGRVLSDRVAFVLILPGPPLPGQARSLSPNLGNAKHYLDTITITTTTPGCALPPCTFSNADLDNDFVMGDDSTLVGNSLAGYASPYQFNDRVLYVTIDELITAISARASGEARKYIQAVSLNPLIGGRLPHAGHFQQESCTNLSQGALPGPVCVYDSSGILRCEIAGTHRFTLPPSPNPPDIPDPTFDSSVGSCTVNGRSCDCLSGQGSCTKTTAGTGGQGTFSCDADGLCLVSGLTGERKFEASSGSFYTASPNCSASGSICACSNIGSCLYTPSTTSCTTPEMNALAAGFANLPDWFADNDWHHYIFYAASPSYLVGSTASPTPQIRVGAHSGYLFLLGNAGAKLQHPAQSRPSQTLANYLEDAENSNGDETFTAPSPLPASNDILYGIRP